MKPKKWLDGAKVNGHQMYLGMHLYCAGCGASRGEVCYVEPEVMPRIPKPDFPFDQNDCPVCFVFEMYLGGKPYDPDELTIEQLSALGQSRLRKALIIAKKSN